MTWQITESFRDITRKTEPRQCAHFQSKSSQISPLLRPLCKGCSPGTCFCQAESCSRQTDRAPFHATSTPPSVISLSPAPRGRVACTVDWERLFQGSFDTPLVQFAVADPPETGDLNTGTPLQRGRRRGGTLWPPHLAFR